MSTEDFDVQLELKERIDFPAYIENAFTKIFNAFNNEKIPKSKVQDMILNFYYDIPRSWKDETFQKDVEKIITEKEIPNIIKWCGITMSKEYMEKNDIPLIKKVKTVNYFKLKNAIINLLDRLNMLVRKDKIEYSTGRNLEYESLDDLIEELSENENDTKEV
ncbi:hypothetical protein ES702_00719 [subsurface metagenome]